MILEKVWKNQVGGGGEYYKTFEEGVSVTIRLPESDTETSTYCLKPFY